MDTHGVNILDGADDDGVVIFIPHHFHLKLFPTQQGFLDQNLTDGAGRESRIYQVTEFLVIIGGSSTGTSHGERRTNNGWESRILHNF